MSRLLDELQRRAKNLDADTTNIIRIERDYFAKNQTRMDYPESEKLGAPIGSAAVESACKQFQGRFKGPGQFWTQEGAQRLLTLNILRKNNDWERAWSEAA